MSVIMSVNASSPFTFHCTIMNITTTSVRAILLLPLSIFILYLGFQKWRQHSLKTASHSDFFTYHMAAMELIWVLGCLCYSLGLFAQITALAVVGEYLTLIILYGEILFYTLTCVERYLAVVHPVIYMGVRNTRCVRIRNIIIGCVWMLCFVLMSIRTLIADDTIELFCLLVVSIIVTCYCSISVLCMLIRPGPGDGAREKERVDQSKQRAFRTITAISGALWLWFFGLLVAFALTTSHLEDSCLVLEVLAFCNIPSYLVLPLLYLHKAGKLRLPCYCKE